MPESLSDNHPRREADIQLLLISNSRTPGGGYLDHCATALDRFLENIDQLLFVPFALGDLDGYTKIVRDRFRNFGCDVVSIHESENPTKEISDAKAIFVGGGNTFRLLRALHDHRLFNLLKNKAWTGTPYIGSSAGLNLACPTIKTTNDMPIVYPPNLNAFNLIPFNINPHYFDASLDSTHMGETREERIIEFLDLNTATVLGLREGAWLRLTHGKLRLEGKNGARLFRRGRKPRNLPTGTNLDFLLLNPK